MRDDLGRGTAFGREDSRPEGDAVPAINDDLRWREVGEWLRAGAGDIVASGFRGLLFGLCFVGMGHAIVRAHGNDWPWLPGLAAAFLFLGPLLAVGLYELSRQRGRGEAPDMLLALFAWCRNPRGLCRFAALLCALLSLWLWTSLALVERLELADPTGVLATLSAGASGEGATVVLPWWLAWIAFSLLAFVSSVIAVPMLLDRPIGAIEAVRASVACCLANPRVMTLWALAVALLVGLSLWLAFWPLLVVGPWLGHATWHVYRSAVGEPPGAA